MFQGLLNEVGFQTHNVDHDAFTGQILKEEIFAESLPIQKHHRTFTVHHNGFDSFWKDNNTSTAFCGTFEGQTETKRTGELIRFASTSIEIVMVALYLST